MPSEHAAQGYHHGDLGNALLAAANRVLIEKGVDGLSLRAVARVAGVSHAAPYRHFRDKAALLRALTRTGFEQLGVAIDGATEGKPCGAEQKLVAACVAYVSQAVQHPEITRLMFADASGSVQAAARSEASATVDASLLKIIREGVEQGSFRQRPPQELAMVVWAAMHGLAMLALSGSLAVAINDEPLLDEQVRAVARNVLYGIVK